MNSCFVFIHSWKCFGEIHVQFWRLYQIVYDAHLQFALQFKFHNWISYKECRSRHLWCVKIRIMWHYLNPWPWTEKFISFLDWHNNNVWNLRVSQSLDSKNKKRGSWYSDRWSQASGVPRLWLSRCGCGWFYEEPGDSLDQEHREGEVVGGQDIQSEWGDQLWWECLQPCWYLPHSLGHAWSSLRCQLSSSQIWTQQWVHR